MDRLTLPREQKTVDAGKCLPAGDSLPSWSTLPLDAKFPMVPTPKGTLTLFTTKYCSPKYRRKSSSSFDLTDPNGMSMSSEYHPLHDPHLKAHFSVPWMRRHLVRNGFITNSGMVVCNLKEFNKYRQYLRRICLMELMRKKDGQKDVASSMRMDTQTADDVTSNLSARFSEVRRRQIEKIEKRRLKLAMMAKVKGEQMERKRQEQMERQAETLRRRQEEDERRKDTLVKNAEDMERRNLTLLRKWRRRDREHAVKLQDMRRQRELDLERKNKDSWEMRKRVQRERLDRERETRVRVKEAQERDIRERDRYLRRVRGAQMAKLDRLKSSARSAREERERICTARLARRIAAATRRDQLRYRDRFIKSPFRSEWTLQQVLRRLSFPELTRGSSHELMQMLSAAIDEAVDRVTSHSDVDITTEAEEEEGMRKFAADLVESVVSKVRNEIYPAYLRLLESDKEEDLYDEMNDQGEFGTDDELNFSGQGSDENGMADKGSRSVRFSFDEAIIPVSMDSLDVFGLKPVSEHTLTPVPSPLPMDGTGSEFDFRVEGPSKPTKRESGLVESLLLRLLDDLNYGRLTREELLTLTGYCIEVIKAKEIRRKEEGVEVAESSSGYIADELVKFTLNKILEDIKSGSVSQEDLTALTQSIVKDAQHESGIEPEINDDDLDRLISSALSGAMEDGQGDDDEHVSDWMLDDLVSRTLSQVKDDLENQKLTEEELKEMGAAIVSAVLDEVASDESLMAEEIMKKTLHEVLEDVDADRLVTATMDKVVSAIVSSYHALAERLKSNSDVIEEFVTDVLTQVAVSVKAGEYSDHDLTQITSAKMSPKKLQATIETLLTQIEGGGLTEGEMLEIGNVLVDTGRKLLASRGIPSSSKENVEPEEMSSTEIADRVVRDVIETIQSEMEDEEFEKEALKALAASFLKVRTSSIEGISNVPTVGSSRSPSYFSTMKPPSPTESSLATDVVLAAMDRITRDLTERNIPVHMLSSIAFSIASEDRDTPSIIISEETLQSSSLPYHVRNTLMDIVQLLRTDRVCYNDAKKMFVIILQGYLCGARRGSSTIALTDEDSRMIEEFINETLNSVIRNVAADVSSVSLLDKGIRLSEVMSEEELEKFIWNTLHKVGQEASTESLIARPSAPVQFMSHSSVDSKTIESLVRQTLLQVAHDIGEGITSDSSLVDTRREVGASRSLISKVVGFVNSVLEELVVGLESGTVSKTSIVQFMGDICPGQDFKEMEVEKLHMQLLQVMKDVTEKGAQSVYFHVIAEKFSAMKAHDKQKTVMTPELQMIGNILSTVDAKVLTQFVQATLLTVLGGEQTPSVFSAQVKPGSLTSLLKMGSSEIAQKVVDDVITRIEKDISDGSISWDETVRKDSSELASLYVDDLMCQIQCEIDSGHLKPDDIKKMKEIAKAQRKPSTVSTAAHSLSGNFSNYVMQTLKNVVSDLRLAQGQISESGLFSASECASRGSGSLLDDFIYKQLQQAVENLSQDLSGRLKEKGATTSAESRPATREPSAFITDVLNEVVAGMIVEKVVQDMKTDEKSEAIDTVKETEAEKASSSEIAKLVLTTLKHALSDDTYSHSSLIARESSKDSISTDADVQSTDSTPKDSKVAAQKQSNSEPAPDSLVTEHDSATAVSELVAEVINQTMVNIKEGKLSQDEMTSLAKTLSGEQEKAGIIENFILDILEGVKCDILSGVVSTDNIENVAQQIATLALDKKNRSIRKEAKVDSESSTSTQSIVKEVLSHIVVSFSDEGTEKEPKKETEATKVQGSNDSNTNGNRYVASLCSDVGTVSVDVISNLGNLSIRDSPGGLEPAAVTKRNSFRSVITPDAADVISASSAADTVSDSQGSNISLDSQIIANFKQDIAGSSKSLPDVKKKSSKHQTSEVSVSSGDNEFVKESLPKETASRKSSSSDPKQKGAKKPTRSVDTGPGKKSSTQAGKSRDGAKKVVAERGLKVSAPAIQVDSCSSASNTSSRTRMSSSSSTSTVTSWNSKQGARPKKTSKKQEVKDVPDVKVSEACGDAQSTSSDCSSQADVMQIKSVCGSHTTQVRVRDSQSDATKD